MDKTENAETYWATLPSIELVSVLDQKVSDFDRHIDMTGRWLTWRDLYYNYYLVNEQNYLYPNFGADGFKRLNINHFRAILKHLLSLVTAQRAAPIPIATNSDAKSQAQTNFCKNILRYEDKSKHLEKKQENATELSLVMGGAYVAREWDATLGEVYGQDPESGTTMHTGDYTVNVFNPLDCIFDFASSSWEDSNWLILRRYMNRWDLLAKFPLYADQIKAMSISPEIKRHRLGHAINEKNDDLIPVYTFYHKKTAAMPSGRAALYIDSNTCLFDGTLPYPRIPVSRIACDDQENSPFPYSVSMDLLPIQKVYNALCSAVCTNQAAFGVQNVLIPTECGITVAQLSEGLNAIYYNATLSQGAKPEALNLLMTAPEIFKFIEYLEQKMAQISGVNDTIQGNPAANLKSGTALAFVASQAMTFISPLARSYNSLLEDTWTGIVELLKDYATTPRMVLISGLSNKTESKYFTGNDIADISRVIVEAGNPLTQTLAGRIQISEQLLQAGLLTKEEYMTVIQTGQIEPIYAYEKAELLSIKQAVEDLQAGKQVKALITDNHPLWIREMLTVLASQDARMANTNPVQTNTLSAIQQHLQMWRTMDPALAAIQNIPPCPQLQPPPPPPPPERISVTINFADLPPEDQARLASQIGLAPPPPPPGSVPPPQPGVNTGRENPNGSKRPGAPNIPGVIANQQPPTPGAPNMPQLPKGSPAPVQAGFAALQNVTAHQPMPQ